MNVMEHTHAAHINHTFCKFLTNPPPPPPPPQKKKKKKNSLRKKPVAKQSERWLGLTDFLFEMP